MVSGVFWIWQLRALTGSVKQSEMTVLFMVSGRSSAFADLEACRVQRQQNVGLLNLGAEELACPVYSCRTYLADAREKQNALGLRVL